MKILILQILLILLNVLAFLVYDNSMQKGQVYKIHSDFYYLTSGEDVFECKVREVLKKQNEKIFVGDFVEFENGYITKICERKSYIPRPSVANVDQIVIVSALKSPDLDFNQLDRYIAFAKYYGLDVKLCFNKEDLDIEEGLLDLIKSIYEPLGYEIFFTSAKEHWGVKVFEQVLEGKTSVLCGSSGVGKSSLINAINPEFHLKTKEISAKTGRGTHTTRHCEIMKLNPQTKIIDTPGFSNLKFDFILPTEVDLLFDEISCYRGQCKFADCLHHLESGCAVLDNMDKIPYSRYTSYLAFVEEAKDYKEKVKYEGKKIETSKKKINGKTAVKISERKRQSARNTLKQKIYKDVEHE